MPDFKVLPGRFAPYAGNLGSSASRSPKHTQSGILCDDPKSLLSRICGCVLALGVAGFSDNVTALAAPINRGR
jgi:hypothetical protein